MRIFQLFNEVPPTLLHCVLALILLIGFGHCSVSSYEPFNPEKQLSEMQNNLETSNRNTILRNTLRHCDVKEMLQSIGFNDLQEIIRTISARKGTSPFIVIHMLYKSMKNKEDLKENQLNTIETGTLPVISAPSLPPVISMPFDPVHYLVSPNSPPIEEDSQFVFVPAVSEQSNKMKPGFHPSFGIPPHPPVVFPLMTPVRGKSVFGATIEVHSGNPLNPIDQTILVTVSPLMTFVEALRQAETKLQYILGLDKDVFQFSHSAEIDCYILNRINDVAKSENSGWKVSISNRDGQTVYDSFCLPNGKDALVKPGTFILLSYTNLFP